jgi:hypothetical protein
MFDDWGFTSNITIDDNESFYFRIKTRLKQDCENEEQLLILRWHEEFIEVSILTKSEDDKELGKYYLKDESDMEFGYKKGEFERNNNFWEIMFLEHLLF